MGTKDMKILIFALEGERYATDIRDVERILEYTKPTEMPDTPDFIEGIINHQNEIIPIVDLEKKFKFKCPKDIKKDKIIVIKRKDKKFGIVVEKVYEVTTMSMETFEEAPEITVDTTNKYMRGLIKLDNNIVILLNLGKILTEEEENLIFLED